MSIESSMTSIAASAAALGEAKADIAEAIEDKGVTVPTGSGMGDFAGLIGQITEAVSPEELSVVILDGSGSARLPVSKNSAGGVTFKFTHSKDCVLIARVVGANDAETDYLLTAPAQIGSTTEESYTLPAAALTGSVTVQSFLRGDITQNGKVNVSDLQMVSEIVTAYPNGQLPEGDFTITGSDGYTYTVTGLMRLLADATCDGLVTQADVNAINAIVNPS